MKLAKLILFAWLRASAAKQMTAAAFLYSFLGKSNSVAHHSVSVTNSRSRKRFDIIVSTKPELQKKNFAPSWTFRPLTLPRCPETSCINRPMTRHHTLEERRPRLYRYGSGTKFANVPPFIVSWFKTRENAKNMCWCIERGSFMAT